MHLLMVSCVRRFICNHHLGILLQMAWFVVFVAVRAWFERFASVVTAAGFSPGTHDPTLFVHCSSRGRTLLLLYVDDMIITGDEPEYIAFVKARLSEQFLMSDLGPLRYFLGIEVSSNVDGFFISQERYIQDLLSRAALTDERTVETPMELNLSLRASDDDPLSDPTRYRHLVGSLVYLAVTRPDISYSVHILSQFVSAPTTVHYSHLLRVLRYLRGTISLSLFFPRSSSSAIRTLRGRVILRIVVHFLLTVCFLVVRSLLGRRRNRHRFPFRVLRLGCVLWPC